MSRTIKFAQAGGPEVLEFVETEVPAPGPHEVRIKVKAIGINRADSMWRNDKYTESPTFPAGNPPVMSMLWVTGDAEHRKIAVEYVTKALASGALKPVIDRTFEFDEMVEVHRYLENSGQFGKIVVTL